MAHSVFIAHIFGQLQKYIKLSIILQFLCNRLGTLFVYYLCCILLCVLYCFFLVQEQNHVKAICAQ